MKLGSLPTRRVVGKGSNHNYQERIPPMSLNPQTSINLKLIGGVVTICVSVIGAAWSGVNAIGKMVYDFAEIQTKTLEEIKNLKVEVHGDVVPSIDKLKDAVHVAET